ncbi:zinc finger protein RFP-like [Sphaerodactylus townsendi]|nr:zinc finger protein RFP-like [Sphaerodactylus townsendi]
MAAPNPEKTLQDEATCSICLDYFQDPVMIIDCGHNFCRKCIVQCCAESSSAALPCPQCRKHFLWKNLHPNRHLWSIVELAKQFSRRRANEDGKQKLCEKHLEPLKLFCEYDQTPMCVVCDKSRAHKAHSVVPIEEAAEVYKDKLHQHLQMLKEEKENMLLLALQIEKPIQELLKDTAAERQKLLSVFQQLQEFLEKHKQHLLSQLDEVEEQVEAKQDKDVMKLSEEISRLEALIQDLEQKFQELPSGLLQDIGSTMNRCMKDKFQPPIIPDCSKLRRILQIFSEESASLQQEVNKFKEKLSESKSIQEYVVLDRGTAHPRFLVTDDRRSVTLGSCPQKVMNYPKRFDPAPCVLGSRGFSSGKHHWTVDVGDGTFWAVGVAQESVQRKGQFSFIPEEGIWAVSFSNGQHKALTSPPDLIDLNSPLKKIQVCLDYERQTVAFYNVELQRKFCCFQSANFEGKTLFPFFQVGDMKTTLFLC